MAFNAQGLLNQFLGAGQAAGRNQGGRSRQGGLGGLVAGASASAQYTPPLCERPAVAGPRTQMLNLGSVHLSSHGDWQRTWLAPLNAKLAAWQPQVVTVESLSGAQCELMRQVPQRYAEAYEHY